MSDPLPLSLASFVGRVNPVKLGGKMSTEMYGRPEERKLELELLDHIRVARVPVLLPVLLLQPVMLRGAACRAMKGIPLYLQ
jgi:hypothetical protein